MMSRSAAGIPPLTPDAFLVLAQTWQACDRHQSFRLTSPQAQTIAFSGFAGDIVANKSPCGYASWELWMACAIMAS
jgi:hypothetical protein